MQLRKLPGEFTVCKISNPLELSWEKDCMFIGKIDGAFSLTCLTEDVPSNCIEREDGWKGFCIHGTLDFSLIGILSPILSLLAEHKISVFAESTYDTDYVLVKKENFLHTIEVLEKNGYTFIEENE